MSELPYEKWKELLKITPMIAVDAVIFKDSRILLLHRAIEPYKGTWCLPGGFLHYGETLEEGIKREVKEETGLSVSISDFIGIYDNPKRDPRGHVIGVAYLAEARSGKLKSNEESSDIAFFDKLPSNITPPHKHVLEDAMKLIRERL